MCGVLYVWCSASFPFSFSRSPSVERIASSFSCSSSFFSCLLTSLRLSSCLSSLSSAVIQGKKSPQKRTVTVEERLLIHVRQVDSSVSFLLYKKGLLKSELIAQLQLKVKEDLFDKQFPKRQWYVHHDPRDFFFFFSLGRGSRV